MSATSSRSHYRHRHQNCNTKKPHRPSIVGRIPSGIFACGIPTVGQQAENLFAFPFLSASWFHPHRNCMVCGPCPMDDGIIITPSATTSGMSSKVLRSPDTEAVGLKQSPRLHRSRSSPNGIMRLDNRKSSNGIVSLSIREILPERRLFLRYRHIYGGRGGWYGCTHGASCLMTSSGEEACAHVTARASCTHHYADPMMSVNYGGTVTLGLQPVTMSSQDRNIRGSSAAPVNLSLPVTEPKSRSKLGGSGGANDEGVDSGSGMKKKLSRVKSAPAFSTVSSSLENRRHYNNNQTNVVAIQRAATCNRNPVHFAPTVVTDKTSAILRRTNIASTTIFAAQTLTAHIADTKCGPVNLIPVTSAATEATKTATIKMQAAASSTTSSNDEQGKMSAMKIQFSQNSEKQRKCQKNDEVGIEEASATVVLVDAETFNEPDRGNRAITSGTITDVLSSSTEGASMVTPILNVKPTIDEINDRHVEQRKLQIQENQKPDEHPATEQAMNANLEKELKLEQCQVSCQEQFFKKQGLEQEEQQLERKQTADIVESSLGAAFGNRQRKTSFDEICEQIQQSVVIDVVVQSAPTDSAILSNFGTDSNYATTTSHDTLCHNVTRWPLNLVNESNGQLKAGAERTGQIFSDQNNDEQNFTSCDHSSNMAAIEQIVTDKRQTDYMKGVLERETSDVTKPRKHRCEASRTGADVTDFWLTSRLRDASLFSRMSREAQAAMNDVIQCTTTNTAGDATGQDDNETSPACPVKVDCKHEDIREQKAVEVAIKIVSSRKHKTLWHSTTLGLGLEEIDINSNNRLKSIASRFDNRNDPNNCNSINNTQKHTVNGYRRHDSSSQSHRTTGSRRCRTGRDDVTFDVLRQLTSLNQLSSLEWLHLGGARSAAEPARTTIGPTPTCGARPALNEVIERRKSRTTRHFQQNRNYFLVYDGDSEDDAPLNERGQSDIIVGKFNEEENGDDKDTADWDKDDRIPRPITLSPRLGPDHKINVQLANRITYQKCADWLTKYT